MVNLSGIARQKTVLFTHSLVADAPAMTAVAPEKLMRLGKVASDLAGSF